MIILTLTTHEVLAFLRHISSPLFSDLVSELINLLDQLNILSHDPLTILLMDIEILLQVLLKHLNRLVEIVNLVTILLLNVIVHLLLDTFLLDVGTVHPKDTGLELVAVLQKVRSMRKKLKST